MYTIFDEMFLCAGYTHPSMITPDKGDFHTVWVKPVTLVGVAVKSVDLQNLLVKRKLLLMVLLRQRLTIMFKKYKMSYLAAS